MHGAISDYGIEKKKGKMKPSTQMVGQRTCLQQQWEGSGQGWSEGASFFLRNFGLALRSGRPDVQGVAEIQEMGT